MTPAISILSPDVEPGVPGASDVKRNIPQGGVGESRSAASLIAQLKLQVVLNQSQGGFNPALHIRLIHLMENKVCSLPNPTIFEGEIARAVIPLFPKHAGAEADSQCIA